MSVATPTSRGPLRPGPVVPFGARPRLDSIDTLRGLVMVLMALDHTRDFLAQSPWLATDLQATTVPVFLTRWITHYCAPTFIFLTGIGAFLTLGRGRTKAQLSWFLVSRGLWIVVLELTIVRMEWTGFRLDPELFLHNAGGVLWAIGISMVALAGLIYLPRWLMLTIGLAMILGHNAFDRFDADWGNAPAGAQWAPLPLASAAGLWRLLHVSGAPISIGVFSYAGGYPIVPWVGVMAVGFAFGPVVKLSQPLRLRWYVGLGLVMTAAFVLLRWTNAYGDPHPWMVQDRGPAFTVLSFLNCQKYPPSLCYLLMTLGPALLVLALFDAMPAAPSRALVVYGRVPMFFYLLHLALIFVTGRLLLACGWSGSYQDLVELRGLNVPLPMIYSLWLSIVFLLYWPCRWYAGLKQRHKSALLSYL